MPVMTGDTRTARYRKHNPHHSGLYPESEDRLIRGYGVDPRFLEEQPYDEAYGPTNPRRSRTGHDVDEWAESPEIEAVLIRVGAGQQAVHNVRENLALHPELLNKRGSYKK